MKYNLHMALPDDSLSLSLLSLSLYLPPINSEAPVIHAMSSLALFSWPTPPASILTLESCRTVIPTASEHGVCKIPSQGVLVLTIYLWSQDKSWAFSTVDTMMGSAEACARLICLWPGHCRDSRGALAFDMLPRFAVAAKSLKKI